MERKHDEKLSGKGRKIGILEEDAQRQASEGGGGGGGEQGITSLRCYVTGAMTLMTARREGGKEGEGDTNVGNLELSCKHFDLTQRFVLINLCLGSASLLVLVMLLLILLQPRSRTHTAVP